MFWKKQETRGATERGDGRFEYLTGEEYAAWLEAADEAAEGGDEG